MPVERPQRVQVRLDQQPVDSEGRVHGQGAREGRARPLSDHHAQVPQQRLRKYLPADRVQSVVGTIDEDYLGITKASTV